MSRMIQDGSWDHIDTGLGLGFGIFKIEVDLTKYSRVGVLEDMDVPERSQEHHDWQKRLDMSQGWLEDPKKV